MQMPVALQNAIENALDGVDAQSIRAAAAQLSMRYRTDEKAPSGTRLLRSRQEVQAYAAFRMPATYAALVRAMEMTRLAGVEDIRTLTDVGSGSGSALWAARQVFGQMERAALVEREGDMIALCKQLLASQVGETQWVQGDMLSAPLQGADLVTASFCLGELAPNQAGQMVRRLWDATGSALLIVEPGTPAGHARIRDYAGILRGLGAHMAAPCASMADCPLGADDWCHFTARVERTRMHRMLKDGELSYEDEKFAFIAVTRDVVKPAAKRIRRRPLFRSGYVELPVCQEGMIGMQKVARSNPAYKKARKAEIGDAWDAP